MAAKKVTTKRDTARTPAKKDSGGLSGVDRGRVVIADDRQRRQPPAKASNTSERPTGAQTGTKK